jgi:uncharacterized protein with GYD domain
MTPAGVPSPEEVVGMPKFMITGSYSRESMAAMVQSPEDRTSAARKLVENVGGKLECFYWAFGPDDFVAIADLPDDESAGAVSMAVSGAGTGSVRTVKLITMDEAQAMLRKAKQVQSGYARPGAAGVR